MRIRFVLLVALFSLALFAQDVSIPDAEQLVGAPRGAALSGPALDARTQEVAAGIRCPVCQGLSVADSPSEMAVNMKGQVRALLARGYTQEQIETYFERSYGQFVLLRPKFEGVNRMVWLLPILALAAGVFVVAAKLRSLAQQPESNSSPQPASDAGDEYVSRVRDLVRGTK